MHIEGVTPFLNPNYIHPTPSFGARAPYRFGGVTASVGVPGFLLINMSFTDKYA